MRARLSRPFDQRIRIRGLRVLFVALVPVLLLTRSAWDGQPWVRGLLETLGVFLVVAAVLGRFWAILYVGGRKNREVVSEGPYSVCRHPLYFFSTLGVAGFGLLLGSVVLGVGLGLAVGLALSATAAREEAWLRQEMGPGYDLYAARVPRLWPRPSLFRTSPEITVRVAPLRRNLGDALGFLALVPLAGLLRAVQAGGWLPTLPLV